MNRLRRLAFSRLYSVLALAVLALPLLQAQESRGSITGQARDSSGAIMARVKVSATNVATKVVTSAVTNSTGNYIVQE
jgi:hypothetical protein